MIAIIGIGSAPLTAPARRRIDEADVVIGARRCLEAAGVRNGVEWSGDIAGMLDEISSHQGLLAVLASGDPGFFGIVRALSERFGPADLEVHPSVSSVAAAFARVALSWDDAVVVSAHGRDPHTAVNTCRALPKVAVLTSPSFSPADLGRALRAVDRTYVVAERLGTPQERVAEVSAHDLVSSHWTDPNVVLVLDGRRLGGAASLAFPARSSPARWGLEEGAFSHRNSMITKAEVRSLVMARLGPGVGDLVWDVGAGSGSVAVECARFGAAVIAIDSDAAACDSVTENAGRHGVDVSVVRGSAPEALEELPDPDAVFVGGTGARLEETLEVVSARAARCAVVTVATLERVPVAAGRLAAGGLRVGGSHIQAARLVEMGGTHRLKALNPVFVVWGDRE
ncbi:MAG TPA: precorrin-6y C5,15-methyltransferase (decarboxylating) subunit CbiE [Actinomycetota bacterium]|nr:precorrin-6y C5,15-methyltransferase (decarboxylating) subunit CbiE [Actinomycetota bacterium]